MVVSLQDPPVSPESSGFPKLLLLDYVSLLSLASNASFLLKDEITFPSSSHLLSILSYLTSGPSSVTDMLLQARSIYPGYTPAGHEAYII